MNTWTNINVGEYGWAAELVIVQDKVAVDIAGYTTHTFVFTKPDGTELEKPAAFATDGNDGVLRYLVEDGLIDTAAMWKVRAEVAKSDASLVSETVRFYVQPVGG